MNAAPTTTGKGHRGLLQLLVLGLAVIVATLGYLLWAEYRDAIRDAETNGRNLDETIEARLDASLRRTDAVLQGVLRSLGPVAMQFEGSVRFASRIDAELDARAQNFPELAGLRVFDADGRLLYASGRNAFKGTAHVDDRSFYRYLREHPEADRYYSEVFAVRSTGGTSFAVAYAVRGEKRRFLGVAVALINLDYFQELARNLDIGPNGLIAIRRSDDFRLVLREPPMASLLNTVLPDMQPTRLAIERGEKQVLVRLPSLTDGMSRVFALRRLDYHPFYVMVAIAEDDVLADWRQRAKVIGVTTALAMGLVLLVLWRFVRSERQVTTALTELAAQERRFRSLFHDAPVGHALNRYVGGGFAEVNPAFAELTGYSAEELEGLTYLDLTPEKYAPAEREQGEILRRQGRYGPYEKEYRRKDGTFVDVRLNGVLFEAEDGEKLILSVVENISDRKRAEAQLRLMASIFEHAGEAILITDRDNRIVAVNNAFSRLTGYTVADVLGSNPRILSSGRTTPEEYAEMWRAINANGIWHGELWDRRKDGGIYPKWLTISVLRDDAGAVTHYIGSFTDISDRKAAEEQIRHLAHHDALTGLPNRFHLRARLEQALATAQRDDGEVAVIFLDLDRFKVINDTLGHHVGDQLLVEVGRRLRAAVRASDVVARLGGDEFIVVLTDVDSLTARRVGEKIIATLADEYRLADQELHSTPSLGIAMYPADGDSVDTLMKNADTAMYQAKTAGRNTLCFFTANMNHLAAARLSLENRLRKAIEQQQFEVHYQPQIDLRSGCVVCVEALLRWRHPVDGLISPLDFIPLAEETGLIVPIGDWVLGEAVRQLGAWHVAGFEHLQMAVNVSVHQLRNPEFAGSVAALLKKSGIVPRCLELEITESVAMDDPHVSIARLGQLRAMGVELAIDDFGTGYSSLSYLKRLPIQGVKIDRSFVMDIESDPNDAAICKATIAMAHSLGLATVAEGVESNAQRDFLTRLGCDFAQGYLFSRPRPAAELTEYLYAASDQTHQR